MNSQNAHIAQKVLFGCNIKIETEEIGIIQNQQNNFD